MKVQTDQDTEVPRLLEGYLESAQISFIIGSGASMPAISLAGGIEEQINTKLAAGQTAEANLQALDFIEGVEEQHVELFLGAEDQEVEETRGNYIRFLKAVDQLLFERKNILLPRQANIFTTNYDLYIEHAATRVPSLIVNDGLDRTIPVGTDFPFSPERFFDRVYRSGGVFGTQAEVPLINLIKLHGSLNWKISRGAIAARTSTVKRLTALQKSQPELVAESLAQRVLVLPNVQKFNSTVIDRTYYDLLRMYANTFEKDNALLLAFGFSFSDDHILDLTRRSLRNPTSQLVIFAYDQSAVKHFSEKFQGQRNVRIISPSGQTVSFARFCTILESVAPVRVKPDA